MQPEEGHKIGRSLGQHSIDLILLNITVVSEITQTSDSTKAGEQMAEIKLVSAGLRRSLYIQEIRAEKRSTRSDHADTKEGAGGTNQAKQESAIGQQLRRPLRFSQARHAEPRTQAWEECEYEGAQIAPKLRSLMHLDALINVVYLVSRYCNYILHKLQFNFVCHEC